MGYQYGLVNQPNLSPGYPWSIAARYSRGIWSDIGQRMDLVFFFRENYGDMGRNQRFIEVALEFKMGGLKSTIRDRPTSRARGLHIRMREREIGG